MYIIALLYVVILFNFKGRWFTFIQVNFECSSKNCTNYQSYLYFENITIFTKLLKEKNTLEYYNCHSDTKKDDSIIKVWIYFSNSLHHFSNYIHLKYIPKTVRTQFYWLNHYFIYVVCIKVVMHLIFKNISKSRTINLKKK